MNNKEKIKLVAFDMDGTIYTSEGILVPSYHTGIEKYNIKYGMNLRKPTVEELEHQIGQPVKIIFRNLFPEMKNEADALLEDFFIPLVTINDTTITKKADILKTYMDQFQLTAEEIVMVGDRSSDLEAARIVNCQFIGCDYGFAAHEIAAADRVVKDFKDILQYL